MFRGKTILLCAGLIAGSLSVKAQLFYNSGANVAVTGGGVLYIDGATENAGGLFSNAGTTTIIGYFRNGALATGGSSTGIYKVFGDWENNSTFTADQSSVILNGNAQQITGSQITTFYQLELQSAGSVKSQTLDANVSELLKLNDCELATKDYKMFVQNVSSAAIARNNGFVSSTGPGRLIRSTNSTDSYLFPTGWNDNNTIYYRPVQISPSVTDAQSFSVRMAYGDATLEGYDVSTKSGIVTRVNPKFFHLIKQIGGTTPSALSIFYDQVNDGLWSSIGRWQTVPEWEDLMTTTLTAGSPLSYRTKGDWIDNGDEPHALINSKDSFNVWNFPNVFAPGTSDPNNSSFHIIDNLNLVIVQDMKIFDRWGEKVFDSQSDGTTCTFGINTTPCWNGYYRNKLQGMGNYVYVADIKVISTGDTKHATGNLSLIW